MEPSELKEKQSLISELNTWFTACLEHARERHVEAQDFLGHHEMATERGREMQAEDRESATHGIAAFGVAFKQAIERFSKGDVAGLREFCAAADEVRAEMVTNDNDIPEAPGDDATEAEFEAWLEKISAQEESAAHRELYPVFEWITDDDLQRLKHILREHNILASA